MTTSTGNTVAARGPAFLELGFRPFFLGAAIWAASAMLAWLAMLAGSLDMPTALDPVSWHAHELLFGYLGAVLGGFMMTAVPNWTGRPPVDGWRLAGLFTLWIAGRGAIAFSAMSPPLFAAIVDLSFPTVLLIAMTREIAAAGNWRNLMIAGLLGVFILANGVFHLEAAGGEFAANGLGFRMGLAAAIMMISVVGGRIIPAFTRNWLVRRDDSALPSPPMQRFDKVVLIATLVVLTGWVIRPESPMTGVSLLVAGVLHLLRLRRWVGLKTLAEPLIWVLHAGYGFIPLGAIALAVSILWPDVLDRALAQHLWMAGGIGVMTLVVMTRATLGHTGRDLSARGLRQGLFFAIIFSAVARFAAGFLPGWSPGLYSVSGGLWIVTFAGFAILYGPMLISPRSVDAG